MNGRDGRYLEALAAVSAAGSSLEPIWDSNAPAGVIYRGTGSSLDDFSLLGRLELLADEGYLERKFVDRISLCPTCGSHALNVHEACLTCGSSNLTQVKVLLHFRCGFVGPVTAFKEEDRGRRCPKCWKLLQDLGADHDSPGDYFICGSCTATFQLPEPGARCLACGARFTGVEMQTIRHRDIFAYRITALGTAALSAGRLLEESSEVLHDADGLLYRRNVIIGHVEDERRRQQGQAGKFGLIVIGRPVADEALAAAVRALLSDTDRLGRLDASHLVALLPDATRSRTKSALRGILELNERGFEGLCAQIFEVSPSGDVEEQLDGFAARLYVNA